MNKDIAIKVENLSKVYKLYNAPIDRLKESLHFRGKKYHKDFYALNDVSFEIKKGECVGILGTNGAGKSTLLKTITGVLTPTSGKVTVNGKVSAILELGAGFNPEYTGIENIYFQCGLMGYEEAEIERKLQSILDFADIGEFVNQPFKSYSSGMAARLAFAVAINIEPDILIVDEALSVGDMFFQAKSMNRMKNLIDNDKTTVLFVSHDISSIKAMCGKAILIDSGALKMIGTADAVTTEYFATQYKDNKGSEGILKFKEPKNNSILIENMNYYSYSDEDFKKMSSFQRVENGKVSYLNVIILDHNQNVISQVNHGDNITIRCFVRILSDITNLVFGFHIRDKNGVGLLYDDTLLQHTDIINVKQNEICIVDWKFRVLLQANTYNVTVVASVPISMDVGLVDMCDYIPIACQFSVEARNNYVCSAVRVETDFSIRMLY